MFVKLFLWFLKYKKWLNWSLLIFYTCKCIFGVGTLCSCASVFSRKKDGMRVLAGLAPTSQTLGSLMKTHACLPARKIWKKVSSMNSLQWKNARNYFITNAFGKVKILSNLPYNICNFDIVNLFWKIYNFSFQIGSAQGVKIMSVD